jgi:hypothetical protein
VLPHLLGTKKKKRLFIFLGWILCHIEDLKREFQNSATYFECSISNHSAAQKDIYLPVNESLWSLDSVLKNCTDNTP